MKKIKTQVKILQKHFGGTFKASKDMSKQGYVIPKVTGSYAEAVNKALAAIESTRPFYNYRKGEITDNTLHRTKRTEEALAKLPSYGDFYIIQAQMGEKYKGKSVNTARESFAENEFGMGTFEVACILLTHPEILSKYEDLWIDCPGDEFDSKYSVDRFDNRPILFFRVEQLKFGSGLRAHANAHCGSPSWFLPAQPLETGVLKPFESLKPFLQEDVDKAIQCVKKAGFKVIKEY